MTRHAKGLLIAALAVLSISPDTLLIRLAGEDYWVTLYWRSLFSAIGLTVLVLAMNGRNSLQKVRRLGRPGLIVTILFSLSNLAFLQAVQTTSVANTLVIISTAPVFAAFMGRIFLAEIVAARTWATAIIVILAIGSIFADELQDPTSWGNFFALASAISLAATFVITQHAKDTDMTPAMAASAIISTLTALTFATSLVIAWQSLVIFAILGGFLTVAFSLLFIAPRYISAAEVSLMMPLETVFGTALVWWIIGEEPSPETLLGGVVILVALTLHSIAGMRQHRAT